MFLWMIEEFAFVLCHLHKDDHDWIIGFGPWAPASSKQLVLPEKGGARGSCRTGPTPLDRLPACTFKTLERAVKVTDTIQLECLAWAMFDNIMRLGEAPPLSGLETYSQIVGHLAGRAYKGLHMHCPAHTSTSFGAEVTTERLEGPESKKPAKSQRYSMMRDVRKEFVGFLLCPQGKTRQVRERQTSRH